jgi:hypothetical protein
VAPVRGSTGRVSLEPRAGCASIRGALGAHDQEDCASHTSVAPAVLFCSVFGTVMSTV